jgi:hypothetical protein
MDAIDTDFDLRNRFGYHAADDSVKQGRHERARSTMYTTAVRLDELLPPNCRETALAITKLEEAMFWANAAIARHDDHGVRKNAAVPQIT